jgi:acylphosphatase
VRVLVRGRVQGVGYRAWTERAARALDLDGWVRNRADGSVEAAFAGAEAAVAAMVARCAEGPRGAAVTDVAVAQDAAAVEPGFRIEPSL